MRLPAIRVPRAQAPRGPEEGSEERDERFEDMFPAIDLPSFLPIPSRRPRMSDTHGARSRRERTAHGR